MKEEVISVLYFAPQEEPVVKQIKNTLEAKQELVEGWIEFVDLYKFGGPKVEAVVNEEGKFIFPPNRILDRTDYIAGPFIVVGYVDDAGYSTSLSLKLIEETKEFFKNKMVSASY